MKQTVQSCSFTGFDSNEIYVHAKFRIYVHFVFEEQLVEGRLFWAFKRWCWAGLFKTHQLTVGADRALNVHEWGDACFNFKGILMMKLENDQAY